VSEQLSNERLTAVLTAGLTWLYDTEQPDGAILHHSGESLPAEGNRRFSFIPAGGSREAIVVVDVAHVGWVDVDPWTKAPANPLGPGELERITDALAELGARVARTWNGYPATTGSLALVRPAHPTLLAAVDRYHAGCLEHPGYGRGDVFCDCDWYGHGNARVIRLRSRLDHADPAAQRVSGAAS
jgi:hypothetical protein